jgi:hypothetical protein
MISVNNEFLCGKIIVKSRFRQEQASAISRIEVAFKAFFGEYFSSGHQDFVSGYVFTSHTSLQILLTGR